MQVKRTRREFEGINVGAFSDIAFLMIIFFILTTTFVQPAGRKMTIPSGTSEQTETEQKQLTIDLTPDEIHINDELAVLTMPELRLRLADAGLPSLPDEQRMVLLQSRNDVPYDRYFKVVMAISQAGGVLALVDESDE